MTNVLTRRVVTGAVTVAITCAGLTGTALAARSVAHSSHAATVVEVVTRKPFGKMLATVHGLSLYYLPKGSCTGGCLASWPPLLMPKGKTVPEGTKCLGTAAFGRSHLEVTYDKHRLYTFTGDSGNSVNGNGVMGFLVAKVVKCG
jgi:predicted lipoprotein with Yx(FWY)xxD motif